MPYEIWDMQERLHRDPALRRRLAARESYLVAADEAAAQGFELTHPHDNDDHFILTAPGGVSKIHIYVSRRLLFADLRTKFGWPFVRLAPEVKEWFGLLQVMRACVQAWNERTVR